MNELSDNKSTAALGPWLRLNQNRVLLAIGAGFSFAICGSLTYLDRHIQGTSD